MQAGVARGVAQVEEEAPLAITAISWFYFARACVNFTLGSILLSYPSSRVATWLIAHARILIPFEISAISATPFINLLAEALFIMTIVSAAIGVMWLSRNWYIRWITMCYAGASLVRTALYFVNTRALGPAVPLTLHQMQVLLAGAVINLLIFAYLAFYPIVDPEFERARARTN